MPKILKELTFLISTFFYIILPLQMKDYCLRVTFNILANNQGEVEGKETESMGSFELLLLPWVCHLLLQTNTNIVSQ